MAARGGRKRQHRAIQPDVAPDPAMPGMAVRACASRLLGAVTDARTPLDGLTDEAHGHPWYMALDTRDRSLVRIILAHALRHRLFLHDVIAKRIERPLPAGASALRHILHVALVQILFLDIPESAAVNIAVAQAKADPRTVRFAALVNAVLRSVARDKDTISLPQRVWFPDWFGERLVRQYGEKTMVAVSKIVATPAPVDLTVKADPEGWADRFGGIALPTGSVRLTRLDGPVSALEGYEDGAWWVQDAAACIPAMLFGDVGGKRIVDLCAAPGGKSAQLAARGASVVALDKSASRLARLKGNFERLRLDVEAVEGDALTWQPVQKPDGVLLDAPCSSTGTIRRHPDVLWTKGPKDIAALADLQRRMLDHASGMVTKGGVIVFSNCSLDKEEGEDMIAAFLKDHPDFAVADASDHLPDALHGLVDGRGMVRTTPADLDLGDPAVSGMDGFFAVRLVRQD